MGTDGTEGVADGGDDAAEASHACVPIDMGAAHARRVARGEDQAVAVPCFTGDEILEWPRYAMRGRPADLPAHARAARLVIYQPRASGDARFLPVGPDEWADYCYLRGREPNMHDAGTWGSKETYTLKVCHLEGSGSGGRALTFSEAGAQHRWTFDVFGLPEASTPRLRETQYAWRRLIKRTLMAFPIEHLRVAGFRSIFIDMVFRQGYFGAERDRPPPEGERASAEPSPRTPPTRPDRRRPVRPFQRGNVVDGGTQLRSGADPDQLNMVLISYSALNRPWWDRPRGQAMAQSDDEITAAYSDHGLVAGTLYHECGHLLDWGDQRSEEGRRLQVLRTRALRAAGAGLWDRFRVAVYGPGGQSQGPAEGFAEAYRYRLAGETPGRNQDALLAEVDAVYDQAAMPTLDSARAVQAQLADLVRTRGWVGAPDEDWLQ